MSFLKPEKQIEVTKSGRFRSMEDIEKDILQSALDHFGGRISNVTRALGIGRSTLYRKIKQFNLVVQKRAISANPLNTEDDQTISAHPQSDCTHSRGLGEGDQSR